MNGEKTYPVYNRTVYSLLFRCFRYIKKINQLFPYSDAYINSYNSMSRAIRQFLIKSIYYGLYYTRKKM